MGVGGAVYLNVLFLRIETRRGGRKNKLRLIIQLLKYGGQVAEVIKDWSHGRLRCERKKQTTIKNLQ